MCNVALTGLEKESYTPEELRTMLIDDLNKYHHDACHQQNMHD